MFVVLGQDFGNIEDRVQFFLSPKTYSIGDFGKMGRIFGEINRKITSAGRNLQKILLRNFTRDQKMVQNLIKGEEY